MKFVCPRFRDDCNVASAVSPGGGVEERRLNYELLECVGAGTAASMVELVPGPITSVPFIVMLLLVVRWPLTDMLTSPFQIRVVGQARACAGGEGQQLLVVEGRQRQLSDRSLFDHLSLRCCRCVY